jgi:hypothetical protein
MLNQIRINPRWLANAKDQLSFESKKLAHGRFELASTPSGRN